jgi:hypothetical protein
VVVFASGGFLLFDGHRTLELCVPAALPGAGMQPQKLNGFFPRTSL